MIALDDQTVITVAIAVVGMIQTVALAAIAVWGKNKAETLESNQHEINTNLNGRLNELVESKASEARHEALDEVRRLGRD